MARLIDADELMKKAEHIPTGIRFMGIRLEFHGVTASAIENAPTIDPESLRAHGHWIQEESDWGQAQRECSCCGCKWLEYARFFAYCPYCGAKMEG